MAKEINDQDFEQEVLKSDKTVLVDFWAPWCGPCQMMGPIIDELAKELEDKIKIVKMNVEQNSKIPGKMGVMSIPALKIFKNGKEIGNMVGLQAKETLKESLEKLM